MTSATAACRAPTAGLAATAGVFLVVVGGMCAGTTLARPATQYLTDGKGDSIEVDASMDVANQRRVNQRRFENLKAFDAVARAHNVSYWATKGTLIGALRHHGSLPWDDDDDVCMTKDHWRIMRRHMHHVRRHTDPSVPARLWVQDWESDPFYRVQQEAMHNTPEVEAKVRDLGTDHASGPRLQDKDKTAHNGIQIDVYWESDDGVWAGHCGSPPDVYPLERVPYTNGDNLNESFTLPVPANARAELASRYGANWHDELPRVVDRKQWHGPMRFEAPAWVKAKYPHLYGGR